MPYRITLHETLPANPPAALDVRITYRDGTPPTTWPVTPVGPVVNTAVVVALCAHDLINVPNAATRALVGHYPVSPHTCDYAISSVMPSAAAEVAV